MNVFTLSSGKVEKGAVVDTLSLKGAGIEIPAILVGEKGRGRDQGVLPVSLLPDQYRLWQEKKPVTIMSGYLGQTKTGNPKLFETSVRTDDDQVLVVMRTKIGYRGGNNHTGDREGWYCIGCHHIPGTWEYDIQTTPMPEECPKAKEIGNHGIRISFKKWPGNIIAKGTVAQGDAGRMGSGQQIISTVTVGAVIRTEYSGRLYGGPSAHYYFVDRDKLVSATWDERQVGDLF